MTASSRPSEVTPRARSESARDFFFGQRRRTKSMLKSDATSPPFGDATPRFDVAAPPFGATTNLCNACAPPLYPPLTGNIEDVPGGSPPNYEVERTVPESQTEGPASTNATIQDVRNGGCCTINIHCCSGQRPSLPTIASAVSFVSFAFLCQGFLLHSPQI